MPGRGVYFNDKANGAFSIDQGFPIISYHARYDVDAETKYRFYVLFPSMEYPGLVKVLRPWLFAKVIGMHSLNWATVANIVSDVFQGITRGEPPPRYTHPDERDKGDKNELAGLLSTFIHEHIAGLDHQPSIIEGYVYTVSTTYEILVCA